MLHIRSAVCLWRSAFLRKPVSELRRIFRPFMMRDLPLSFWVFKMLLRGSIWRGFRGRRVVSARIQPLWLWRRIRVQGLSGIMFGRMQHGARRVVALVELGVVHMWHSIWLVAHWMEGMVGSPGSSLSSQLSA